jgi:hypothetical protein
MKPMLAGASRLILAVVAVIELYLGVRDGATMPMAIGALILIWLSGSFWKSRKDRDA